MKKIITYQCDICSTTHSDVKNIYQCSRCKQEFCSQCEYYTCGLISEGLHSTSEKRLCDQCDYMEYGR